LIKVGLPRFGGVSIIGFNSPEWSIADIGTIFAGGVAAGIYTTNNPPACEYIAKHSDSVVVVCDGLKQLEKFLAIEKNLPKLKALVVYNETSLPEGMKTQVPVYTWKSFMEFGASVDDAQIKKRMEDQKPNQCSTLIYTSGTTGDPKAVMLSHDNVVWTVKCILDSFLKYHEKTLDNTDCVVSYLPLSHIAGQLIDVILPIVTGVQVYYAQPDALKGSLGLTLKEVRPTLFFGVPRVWEKIAEKMWSIAAQTTGLKKAIATWAKGKGKQKSELAQFGNSGGVPCGFSIAHGIVLGRIKEALGLDRCVACFSGAAPIAKEIVDYFGSLDIPIYEFFGQSETTGPQACSMRGIWKIGSCGKTIDGCETRVVPETEELIFRGRNGMMGYLKSEKQTKETIDEEGWIHSGDAGKIDENGFIYITGRIKELIITAGGENIPPLIIEDVIKEEIPLLANVMVVGERRKFLAALFTLRVTVDAEGLPTDKLESKALLILKEIGSTATTVSEAKADPKVKEYLEKGLKRANARATSRAQNVAKFEVLNTDFSIGGGELTPTLKLKRKVALEKYESIVNKLYT
jgi:long-chain-fatty-acid--CoA ligase ACSBG